MEVDRPVLKVTNGRRVSFSIDPFGVKTIRVLSKSESGPPAVAAVRATPLSDMEVMMYQDDTVLPSTTYYYRVCAVDTPGSGGRFLRKPPHARKTRPDDGV